MINAGVDRERNTRSVITPTNISKSRSELKDKNITEDEIGKKDIIFLFWAATILPEDVPFACNHLIR
jgi:hypothetical protein